MKTRNCNIWITYAQNVNFINMQNMHHKAIITFENILTAFVYQPKISFSTLFDIYKC